MRVVQGGGGARLALETHASLRVGRQLRGQDLDRHFAAQARVACPIDLAHASRPEWREDLIGSEERPRGQRHRRSFAILQPKPRV